MNTHDIQATPSAIVSPNKGAAIIFQGGMLTQALVITRSDIDLFLITPAAVEPLIIPSLASAGVALYASTGKVEDITVLPHSDESDEYTLVIKLRNGEHIVYYSNHGDAEEPEALVARGVTIAITPRLIASVRKEPHPSLTPVASLAQAQMPDSTAPYAVEIELLQGALEEALRQSKAPLPDEY